MALKYFKSFNTGSISSGSYAEVEWTPDEDVQIEKILLVERSGTSLNAVTVYIMVGSDVWTKDFVNATVFEGEYNQLFPVNRSVPKGQKIYVKITNSGTSAVNIDVIFYIVS